MSEAFSDNGGELFGRKMDTYRLMVRAGTPGLTAIVARPLMGKTLLLKKVAQRLIIEEDYLVGYHESTGAERSHLLHTVSNLYRSWLTDSTMRDQAISLWKHHKAGLVPRIGQMIGKLFEKLDGELLPGGVGAVVSSAFDGLAEAQRGLLSGGIQITPLPYDQALSLTKLVADVSGRRVVLILDAWEKSPSIVTEFATLEAFLKHQDDWPHTHVFLAVRDLELDSTRVNDDALRRTHDLCKLNPAAQIIDLKPMDFEGSEESDRLINFLHSTVHATKKITDQDLLQMIDGFPGVLNFWTSGAKRTEMRTAEDLREVANNAHSLRYLEFDYLFKALQGNQRTLAARLAFCPRLDTESWVPVRQVLLKDLSDDTIDELIDAKVLADDSIPTYGHDTRHTVARSWFIENELPLIRRTSETIIEALAARITGFEKEDKQIFEILNTCSETAQQVKISSTIRCLIDAAESAFGETTGISRQGFDNEYLAALQHNISFTPLISIALFNRGTHKIEIGDRDGAIADYTTAIGLPGAPAAMVAPAVVNRGLAKGDGGDRDGAIADLTTAIKLPGAPADVVAWAIDYRGRAKGDGGDRDGAIADYTTVTELPGAPADVVAQALVNRGMAKGNSGDHDGAIADYNTAIELPGASTYSIVVALMHRGPIKVYNGDESGAVDDWTTVIELQGAPPDRVAMALVNRGNVKNISGDRDEAITDYTTAIELPGAPDEVVKDARKHISNMEDK